MPEPLELLPGSDIKRFSSQGREKFEEIQRLFLGVQGSTERLCALGEEMSIFNAGNHLFPEDFSNTSFSFDDPHTKSFRHSHISGDDNRLLGFPSIYQQIMGPNRTISIDDRFFTVLNARQKITPKQWLFFMLLGLGLAGYTGQQGALKSVSDMEDDSLRINGLRDGIARLDDFALNAMRIIGVDVSDLGNPFQYIKLPQTGDVDLLFPHTERGSRLNRSIELVQLQ